METSPTHFKGIFSNLFGWGRKEEKKTQDPAPGPVDSVQLGTAPAPAPAPPPVAVAPARPLDIKVGPGQKVELTPDLVAALTSSPKAGAAEELWSRSIQDVVGPGFPDTLGTPVISRDGSTGYFASVNCLFSLDARTGSTGWTFSAGGKGIRSRPLVGPDGSVLVSGGDGQVHALEPRTGTPRWSVPVAEGPGWLSLGADGSLLVATGSGTVALDPKDGARRWSSKVGGPDTAPGVGSQIFSAGDGERSVAAYDRATGAEQWRFSRGGLVRSRPTVGPDGTVYAGDTNGGFYALDPATGQPKWDFKAQHYILYPSALSEDGATVYVGSSDEHLYALDTATGKEKWRRKLDGEIRMTPEVTPDGTLVLASDRNVIYVISEATGSIMAEAKAASYVHVCPSSARGHLVMQANNHTLYGYGVPVARRPLEDSGPGARPAGEISVAETAVRIGGVELPIRL